MFFIIADGFIQILDFFSIVFRKTCPVVNQDGKLNKEWFSYPGLRRTLKLVSFWSMSKAFEDKS